MALNTAYVRSNRGISKILQIICGFVVCSLLCANWYGGRSCFGDGRLSYVSGLNFVVVIINIVIFILNLLEFSRPSIEKIYAIVCVVLFLIAAGILIWFLISTDNARGWLIASTVFIIIIFLLFVWDVKILSGEASNWS